MMSQWSRYARPTEWTLRWKQTKGHVALYVWAATAPKDFVALGEVATVRRPLRPFGRPF